MDKELIFYLLFGLIYLLSRLGKKKRKPQRPPQAQPQPQNQPGPRPVTQANPGQPTTQEEPAEDAPMSFEDILRELSGEGRRSRQEAQPVEAPKPEPPAKKPLVSEPPADQAWSSSEPTYDVSDSDEVTQASEIWGAYKEEKKKQLKTHTSFDADDRRERGQKFDMYKITSAENPLKSEIRSMLEDPEDIKKAIVVAEILKRKF